MNQLIRPHTTQPKQRSLSLFQQLISRIDEYQDKPRPQTQSRQRPKVLAQTLMKKMSQIDSYDPSEPVYERLFPQPQIDERFRLIQVREKALRTKSAIPRSRIIYFDEDKQQKQSKFTINTTQTPVLSCVMKQIQDRPRLLGRDYLEKYFIFKIMVHEYAAWNEQRSTTIIVYKHINLKLNTCFIILIMSKVQILYKYQDQKPNPAIVEFERKFKQLFILTQTKSVYIPEPLITPKEALTEVTQVGVHPSKMVRGKPLTVFQTSGLVEDINERVWYYQDEKKQGHGPLSSREMDTLLTSGRITMQTRVALRSLEKFIRIEKIMQAISQPQQAPIQAPLPAVIPELILKDIKEPFRFSNLTKDFELLLWFYKQGMQDHKGPISTTQMDLLWQQDIVNANTKIGFQDTTKFVKMEKILSLAKHGLEEERKKKEEEQRIKDKGGFLDYQVDLSKVKQNTNLGEWGQPLVAKPVQVVVINPQKQESNKVKSTEGRKRSDNKSLHVEGHQGNLYHKQPKVETIIEEEQQEKKQQEIQQILQKLADKTVEKNQPKQGKQVKQQVIYEVKQPEQPKQEQPKQVQPVIDVKKVEEPKQQTKPQDKQNTQQKAHPAKEQPKIISDIKKEEPKEEHHDEIKNEIIKEIKVEENEDDGWQEVSAPSTKKKNHKQQNKNAHVVGYAVKVDPPKTIAQPIKQVTQVTKIEAKVEQKQSVPIKVIQAKNEPEEVDDGWQEVVKPVRAKPQKK